MMCCVGFACIGRPWCPVVRSKLYVEVIRLAESAQCGRKRLQIWIPGFGDPFQGHRLPAVLAYPPRAMSGSRPHFRVPPRCALAREPADDEIAGRMVRSPDCLYCGGAVIIHAV